MNKLLLIILLTSSINVFAQYQGKVFLDVNENGQVDDGEKLLANVRVSDGLNVVITDTDGTFNLKGYAKTRFIFITSPEGYRTSKSHYLPVKSQGDTYNFGLVVDSSLAGSKIKMMHISDTETDVYGEWIKNIRNYAKENNTAFIVHTGDICRENGLKFHAVQLNESSLKKPIHYAMGNHDLVAGAYGEALFESLFGPPYYSFDAGPAHFIITPMASGDFKPDYTTDQLIAWIRNDLALTDKNKPVFIFNHNLPFNKGNFVLKGASDSIDLAKHGLKAWLYGHWHSNFVTKDETTGIYTICTSALNKGGIDNSIGQFLTVDIDKNGVEKIEPHYAYYNKNISIIQPAAGNMNIIKNGKLLVNVNCYDSELEVKTVTTSITDEKGNFIASQKLKLVAADNWRGEVGGADKWKGKKFKITVEVEFGNGKSKLQYEEFEIGNGNNNTLSLQWSAQLAGNVWNAAPVIVNNMAILATVDDAGNQLSGITALSTETGKVIWKFKTKNSLKHNICYDQGKLLATDVEGNVYAINPVTGSEVWHKNLAIKYLPASLTGSVANAGVYYTGYGNYLQAIRISDGKTIWTNTAWHNGMGSPAKMTVADGVLIVGSNWNALYAHDIQTGKLLWKRDDEGLRFRSGQAAVVDGIVYVTGLNTLFLLNVKTGQTIIKKLTTFDFKVLAAPLVTGNLIIIATAANGIVAFDKTSLKQIWNTAVGEALLYTAPYFTPDQLKPIQTVEPSIVEYSNKLLFGASDGYFYEVDKNNGKVISKINLGAPIYAEVTIKDRSCYVATFTGGIYCFKL